MKYISKPAKIAVRPIGIVRRRSAKEALLIISPEFSEALEGIEEFSHIVVIFWMDRVTKKERGTKKAVPYGIAEAGIKGILATRMQQRPNPIGITTTQLLRRRKNVLIVRGLDAFDASPVLDIKPHTGHPKDRARGARIPWWERKSWTK